MPGLKVEGKSPGNAPEGYFAVIPPGETRLDFFEVSQFEPHHYAFLVSEQEFDAILERMKQAGLEYSADPLHKKFNEINYKAAEAFISANSTATILRC
jgi:hypothetical protein